MQFKVTPKRVLLGTGITVVFGLQIFGKVSSHAWTPLTATLFGLLAAPLAFAAAFTANTPSKADSRGIGKTMLWFAAAVVIWLVIFKILDIFRATGNQ